MKDKPNTRGGARPGSGPKPTGKETATITIRLEKKTITDLRAQYGRKLSGMIAKFLSSLQHG